MNEHLHCETCFKPSKCEYQSVCALVKCPNSCNGDIEFHECKLNEHLSEICANRYTKCVNHNYGCKLQLKYSQLVEHLGKCPANIHVCPSKRLRKLIKQNDNNTNFKWMDPITQLKEQFTYYPKQNQLCITDVLHNIDTNEFMNKANTDKLKFNWVYKHLIVDLNDLSQFDLSISENFKLPRIQSELFADIQIDSCLLYESLFDLYNETNDLNLREFILNKKIFTACRKCNLFMESIEQQRFSKLTSNLKFTQVLKSVFDFNEFKHNKVFKRSEFLQIYNQFINDFSKIDDVITTTTTAPNKDLLDSSNNLIKEQISLSRNFQIIPFDEQTRDYPIQYTIFRHAETVYEHRCGVLLRHDEYSKHLNVFHNLIEHDILNHCVEYCPYSVYGCDYHFSKLNFYFDKCKVVRAELRQIDDNLLFNINDDELNANTTSSDYFSKLPIELFDLILNKLDSFTLYTLSLTSKVSVNLIRTAQFPLQLFLEFNIFKYMRKICQERLQTQGIVYPKWRKEYYIENDELKLLWLCEYYWSFGKCVEAPKHIEYKLPDEDFHKHVQMCPYRVLNEKFEKIKVMHGYANTN